MVELSLPAAEVEQWRRIGARGALAVLQDADGKFLCEVPCGYIVEQTASAHKPRRIQAQRRRRAMLRRRVALTVALLTVAALLAALTPWSGSGAADKPKDTTAGTLEEVHQPTAVLLPSSGTVAGYVPNAAEVEALAKLIYGEAGIVPSTTEQAAVVWCVLNRVDDPRFPDTVLEVIEAPYQFSGDDPEYPVKRGIRPSCGGRADAIPRGAGRRRKRRAGASGGILLLHGRRAAQSLHDGMEKYGLLWLDA